MSPLYPVSKCARSGPRLGPNASNICSYMLNRIFGPEESGCVFSLAVENWRFYLRVKEIWLMRVDEHPSTKLLPSCRRMRMNAFSSPLVHCNRIQDDKARGGNDSSIACLVLAEDAGHNDRSVCSTPFRKAVTLTCFVCKSLTPRLRTYSTRTISNSIYHRGNIAEQIHTNPG